MDMVSNFHCHRKDIRIQDGIMETQKRETNQQAKLEQRLSYPRHNIK